MTNNNSSRRAAGLALLASLALAACGETANQPVSIGVGPNPELPPPKGSLLPSMSVAEATGWSADAKPTPAPGLKVTAFAKDLDHPRWVYVLPNGDVLVAESNAPERPKRKELLGIKGWVMGKVMQRAGAGTPSADRITLLRDADGDGTAELRAVFIDDLNSPFGMVLVDDTFYVANTDAVVRFPYSEGQTSVTAEAEHVVDLPGGPLNHHWTKNIIANEDGSRLYATVGSNSNVAEHGMEEETGRAAIWEIDPATGLHRIYASGLRNPNGMAWGSDGKTLWTVVNERDEIGPNLVPDYLTSVKEKGFYGWPYSYYGQHVDERVEPPQPDLVAKAIPPDYGLGSHVAALGLASAENNRLTPEYAQGMFIGQHGSWNRKPRSGYNVVFVPFEGGKPAGQPKEVLTGFISEDDKALGRPVGVAIGKDGALLVADDVGNVIWHVSASQAQASTAQPQGAAAAASPAAPPASPPATDAPSAPMQSAAPADGASPPAAAPPAAAASQ